MTITLTKPKQLTYGETHDIIVEHYTKQQQHRTVSVDQYVCQISWGYLFSGNSVWDLAQQMASPIFSVPFRTMEELVIHMQQTENSFLEMASQDGDEILQEVSKEYDSIRSIHNQIDYWLTAFQETYDRQQIPIYTGD